MTVSKLFIFIHVTFLASSSVLAINEYAGGECNGTVSGTISGTLVYKDGEVVRVESNRRDPVSSAIIAQFNFSNLAATLIDQERYAGENGIIVEDDGHNILLFPGGAFGQNVVYLFNYTSKSTSAISVYCQPVSLAYRSDDQRGDDVIVGHCRLNTTLMRVPYFVLGVRSGKWTDISPTGLYSNHLDTTDLTNTVILQYESEYDQLATKLYFADGNVLHEINLGNPGVDTYPLPDECQIRHLVPVGNSSFPVLRVTCYNGNSSGYSHHYFASSQSRFMDLIFHTDFVAYDSFNLDYLVTFANYKTLSIIRRDKTSQQFPLNITLDDPIQCENMVMGPNVHYLICLADNGLHPVIINITEPVTSEVIPVNFRIVQIRLLTRNTFYLLTAERELLFYVVNPAIVYLGRYGLRHGIDYVVTSATSNVTCSNVTSKINTTKSVLQLPVIIGMILFSITIVLLLLTPPLVTAIRSCVKKKYRPLSNDDQLLPNNEQPADNDDDENSHTSDGSSFTNVSVESDDSQPTCNTSAIAGPVTLDGSQNNERIIFIPQNNPIDQQETDIKSGIVVPTVNRIPYVIQSGASAEYCDNIARNYERDSNQPEQFIEKTPPIKAVQCKDTSKSELPPATERHFRKQ